MLDLSFDFIILTDNKDILIMDGEAEMRPADFAHLQTLPGNDVCVDCGKNKPDWGSPKLGILFCFECSGKHRYDS